MESALNDIWGGAKAKTSELEEAERQAVKAAQAAREEASSQTSAEILELRQQILAGEGSSGNPLHDGLIVVYADRLNQDLLKKYETVASRLTSVEIGEPIVAIRRWTHPYGARNPRIEATHYLKSGMAMGIANGNNVVFDYEKLSASLPTSTYAYDWKSRNSGDLIKHSGGIKIYDHQRMYTMFMIERLDEELESAPGQTVEIMEPENSPVLEIEMLFGRDHIHEWLAEPSDLLARDQYFKMMRQLTVDLGIPPVEPANEWQKALVMRYDRQI